MSAPRCRDRAAVEPENCGPSRPTDVIKIGPRHRKDLGDIDGLAREIDEVGLLHPVVITPQDELIAGRRRLAAWPLTRFVGEPIPVHIVPLTALVRGEFSENYARKDFTPSEMVAIKRALEPLERERARERMRRGGKGVEIPHPSRGRALDKVAAFLGRDRRTVEKAEAIVSAAEAEPEKFDNLVDAMDRTGRVDGPFKRLQNIKAAAAIRKEPPPLPMNGPYRAGIVDWPWASEPGDDSNDHGARGYYPYPTMQAERAVDFPMASLLHADSSVWLWITNFHLLRGDHLIIAKAWGLRPVALFTWIKHRWGQGQRARGATEHLIQMIRGKVTCLGHDTATWFDGDGGRHSQKPIEGYEIVEKLSPAARYFELFSRGSERSKWDLHGNEVGKNADASPAVTSGRGSQDETEAPIASCDDDLDIPNFLRRGHPECFIKGAQP